MRTGNLIACKREQMKGAWKSWMTEEGASQVPVQGAWTAVPSPVCPPPAVVREDFRVCFMASSKSKCAISLPGKQNIKSEPNNSVFYFIFCGGSGN